MMVNMIMIYLKISAIAGKKKIMVNSKPRQKVHFTMCWVMNQRGDVSSFRALTRRPNTVYATVSDVYIENNF